LKGQELCVKLGTASAFRGLAIFVIVFAVLLKLKQRGMPDIIGVAWWAFVLGASLYLAWKGWRRRRMDQSQGQGGWGAVLPANLSRWMLGEDDANRH
jgi:uncharacterized membrane protein YjgN (DUF898 family)